MDVLDYPIEYHRPIENDKLLLMGILSVVFLILVFAMNERRGQGQGRPYQMLPPSVRD